MRKRRPGQRGQATVEMALVLPLLIWLLIGLVDVARMANCYLIIQHATREAVRLGVTGATDIQVAQRAVTTATTLDPARLTVQVSPAGSRRTGSDITVTTTYRYKVMALMGVIGNEVTLQSRLVARIE